MQDGELVEKKTIRENKLQLMRDIEPYQNTVNRGWIRKTIRGIRSTEALGERI